MQPAQEPGLAGARKNPFNTQNTKAEARRNIPARCALQGLHRAELACGLRAREQAQTAPACAQGPAWPRTSISS